MSLSKYVKLNIKLGLLGLFSILYICDDFMPSVSKIWIWFALVAVAVTTSNFDSLGIKEVISPKQPYHCRNGTLPRPDKPLAK